MAVAGETNVKLPIYQQRWLFLIAALLIFIVFTAGLCGANTPLFLTVLLTDGLTAMGWILGAVSLGVLILRLLKTSVDDGLAIASAGGLGLGAFSLLGLGLGLLGWLNQPVAIAFPVVPVIVLIGLSIRSIQRINSTAIYSWLRGSIGGGWIWLFPVGSLAIVLVSASIMPGILWKPLDPHPYDVTGYHLLVPREWYEAGRIIPLPHNVFSFFEMNVEVQFLLLMHAMGGPFAGMYACQFLSAGYAGMMVLAVAGLGRRSTMNFQPSTLNEDSSWTAGSTLDDSAEHWALKVARWKFAPGSSSIAAVLISTVPWLLMLAGVAYVESALMLYTALAVAWAMRAIDADSNQVFIQCLCVSGAMAGFAAGVKITAVPMLLLAVPVAVAIVMLIKRPTAIRLPKMILGCGAIVLVGSLFVSPWLIRNTVWAGNPIFPLAMKTLGSHGFSPVQVQRFHDAHSPRIDQQSIAGHLNVLWTGVLFHWQFGYFLLPAGLVACLICYRDRKAWLILICGLFVFVVWIGFTHLLPRFLVMLIPIAGLALSRIRWGRAWPIALLLLIAATGVSWSRLILELKGQPQLIGIEDTTFMLADSQTLIDARDRGLQIGMVGDAQAFLYPIPLGRLHYRCVFNLPDGSADPILTWCGSEPIGNPNWLLVINPAEIDRLHRTYDGVPALPPDWAARGPNVFFIRGDQLSKSPH